MVRRLRRRLAVLLLRGDQHLVVLRWGGGYRHVCEETLAWLRVRGFRIIDLPNGTHAIRWLEDQRSDEDLAGDPLPDHQQTALVDANMRKVLAKLP